MERMRAGLALGAVVVFSVAGLLALHGLGRVFPGEAILQNDLELALAAALRLVGLAGCYWLLTTTVCYLLASLSGATRAMRAVSWATLPPLRKLADLAAARTLVAALAVPIPLASVVDPGYLPVPAGDPPQEENTTSSIGSGTTTTSFNPAPTTTTESTTPPTLSNEADAPDEKRAPPPLPETNVAALEVVVEPGDNMWDLAAARLQTVLGRTPTSREIVPYWTRVIEENRLRIRSGDPDLIFPGELLVLPPL